MKSQGWYSRVARVLTRKVAEAGRIVREFKRAFIATGLLAIAVCGSGCTALTNPISGVPARRLPPQFFDPPKSNLVPIDVSRLGQEPPRKYLLDGGDILGVYIEGILPFTPPDQPPTPPPVNFPPEIARFLRRLVIQSPYRKMEPSRCHSLSLWM